MAIEYDGGVALRPWRADDRERLANLANNRRIWINMRDAFPCPYELDDADRFIQSAQRMNPQTYFAIDFAGVLAGGIGYTLHTDVERISAEVGYWLGEPFWGKGIATQALLLVTSLAFSRHPDLCRLYAVPFASNPASARVLEKAGFQREGVMRQSALKDGVVLNQSLYAILRADVVRCES